MSNKLTEKSPSRLREGLGEGMSVRGKVAFLLAFAGWAFLIAALANYAAHLRAMCDDEGTRRIDCSATAENLAWVGAIVIFFAGALLLKRLAGRLETSHD
ncbi:hypothetical protein Q4610_09495 [Sphingobium sp. HBC34]|uniref:Uncharacterized protein n=1 Tax=Sphingobium cyanobacteriorum TaxID=3063954 RepID=A0ABT8ZMS9_9SPHN|nr:hypothetical protein [Sphingobium sp. HBC34]MDO7835284.1 hypothetical protein [Sphingobium sp. HBC34]